MRTAEWRVNRMGPLSGANARSRRALSPYSAPGTIAPGPADEIVTGIPLGYNPEVVIPDRRNRHELDPQG